VRETVLILALTIYAGASDFGNGLEAYSRGDFATALRQWRPLAERGDANCEYNLGLLYAGGKGVPRDYSQAQEWYEKAAKQGVAAAQYNLGVMYANGEGVAKDPEAARKWFLQAAEKGIPSAQLALGRLYADPGVSFHNAFEAQDWYRKAAAQGVAAAAFDLGLMYDDGQGVEQDYALAVQWYRKAADEGYASAMVNLGILYYNAQGVKRDLAECYIWIVRGGRLGEPRAAELLPAVVGKLTPEARRKALAQVDAWHPSAVAKAEGVDPRLFAPKPAGAGAVEPATAPLAPSDAASPAPKGAAAAGAVAPSPAGTPHPLTRAEVSGVARIVAVGDVFGDYEKFARVLESAGLIDGYGNWTGGRTHLVQTGNVVDRGPDARAVIDLLMKLEKQAAQAGGAVHCLIGNHDAMDAYGDFRDVSPAQAAAFAPEGVGQAFGPDGVYGRWVRAHDAAVKIDRTLFVHAGLGAKYADWPLDRINEEVRRELDNPTLLHQGIVTDPDGPLLSTALAQGNEAGEKALVDRLLQHFGVDRIVLGHTATAGAVTPRFGGKVVLIDVGISRVAGGGSIACLEIDRGHAYALHRGQKLDLPKDENGPDMLRFLEQAAALDPRPSPIQKKIDALERSR
jgi:TPR repeat protein